MSVRTRNMLYIVFVVVSLVLIFILSASYLAIARGASHASRVAQEESRLTRNGEPAAANDTASTHGSRHSM